jgi:hypothetical protein
MILSAKAAALLFPGLNPVGRHVDHEVNHKNEPLEVIGVAGDIAYESIRQGAPPAEGYVSITQNEDRKPSYTAVVRVNGWRRGRDCWRREWRPIFRRR